MTPTRRPRREEDASQSTFSAEVRRPPRGWVPRHHIDDTSLMVRNIIEEGRPTVQYTRLETGEGAAWEAGAGREQADGGQDEDEQDAAADDDVEENDEENVDQEEGEGEEDGDEDEDDEDEDEEGGIDEGLLDRIFRGEPMPPRLLELLRGQARTPALPPPPTRMLRILGRPVRQRPLANASDDHRLWQRVFGLADTTPTVPMEVDSPFDPSSLGLKEIGNLASWTVSSYKPGFGVQELRDDDPQMFWQSDGPQPHHINIHFSRLVSILSIRIFLDFEQDESYTPTRITLFAGTGYHDLIPFAQLDFAQPKGWIDVPLTHVGGGDDGTVLRTFLIQVKIVENHQNGKDTHVRGLKVYTKDERIGRGGFPALTGTEEKREVETKREVGVERTWLLEPAWMGEPELR